MKKALRRRITVTSSLNYISAQKKGVETGGRRGVTPPFPTPFYCRLPDSKDGMNGLSSISDIYGFVVSALACRQCRNYPAPRR
jgi:hypothetical protein